MQKTSDLPRLLADRREPQQIFFNLIRNAAQAIEGTGKITISAVLTTAKRLDRACGYVTLVTDKLQGEQYEI